MMSTVGIRSDARRVEASILLVDHDPISRNVLERALRQAPQLRVVGSVDGRCSPKEWPLAGTDTVVLACDPREKLLNGVQDVASRVRVLVVGVHWTRKALDAAFTAGVGGCLIKDSHAGGLAAAVRALAAGHFVLSPALRELGGLAPAPRSAFDFSGDDRSERLAENLLDRLTEREREVLSLLSTGLSTAEAAGRLQVSPATIKSHVSHVITKFGVRNRLEAVLLVQGILRKDVSGNANTAVTGHGMATLAMPC
ncbi:LuxR C-terminal-related transcriptional regulator [Actinomadura rubrisoli]|uniref:Response regulator transcription factor n=1 Tax=Actinomadura rubrisoli TaxID=2530368 RepID=A0A4R5B9Y6_9ACTN|nr:response regulator transcription factor [Actinomadura rubrisoli]TDD82841.1 response regulator transcription factor [Actinomadura rubrisoli]